ncbi:MAG: DsbE family thiol:disulfide interchange protein [Xanthomonadaceae bacterium]|nr:DsbE family thiol:disulfide interchange protein [Xanthomonadaceae bacterium]
MKKAVVIPLVIFLALAALLAVGLNLNPTEVPSPLIGKPLPEFSAPQLHDPEQVFSSEQIKGQVSVLNVFASWCIPCRQEHPFLAALAQRGIAPIYGLSYKDQREDARAWLARFGDVYAGIAYDIEGRIGLDLGVYGVPETFIIDKHGIVRYKHVGPIDARTLNEVLIPWIERLRNEA